MSDVVKMVKQYVALLPDTEKLRRVAIRQGIKEYARWPPIPQLLIDVRFVGGCDIAGEMHANSELVIGDNYFCRPCRTT